MMASLLGSKVEEKPQEPEKPIDREKTCPLLLRVFCNTNRHHSLAEYSRGQVPANELQIYTWMDATLKELTSLVKEVNPDARRKGTFFDFAQVYPEVSGRGMGGMGGITHRMREIGSTCSGQKGADDSKTLSQVRFTIGDYMDIAITPPNMRDLRDMRGGPGPMRRMRPY